MRTCSTGRGPIRKASARRRASSPGDVPIGEHGDALRLKEMLAAFDRPGQPGGLFSERLLSARPEALVEAVEILIARPDAVRTVLTRFPYTDPESIGGYLDRGLPRPAPEGSTPR